MLTVKALFAVTVDLIKGFTDRYTTFFKLNLYQWQPVHQDRHIIAVGMAAGLFKLLDYLHLVADNVLFIQQVYVFNSAIIKNEVMDIVIVDFAGFIDDAVAGLIEEGLNKSLPFTIKKRYVIERLQLFAHIGEHGSRVIQGGQELITLIDQIFN